LLLVRRRRRFVHGETQKHNVRKSYSRFLLLLITAQFLGYVGDERRINIYSSVRHHSKVQCDVSGAKERLVIVPEFWLHFALQNLLCLSVCLHLIAFPDTYIFLYGNLGAELCQYSFYFPIITVSVCSGKFCFGGVTCSRILCYCSY
jgi:hypothetical protein